MSAPAVGAQEVEIQAGVFGGTLYQISYANSELLKVYEPSIKACFSCLTPPVAISAIPAASIAGADYMKTAMEASKVGMLGFIVPFLLVYAPELMLGQTGSGFFILDLVVAVLAILMSGPFVCVYGLRHLNWGERLLFGVAAALQFSYLTSRSWTVLMIGLVLSAVHLYFQGKGLKIFRYHTKFKQRR